MSISAEQFIKAWQGAKSIDSVCRELGITKKSASERASRLRSKGVPLQYFSKTRIMDYDELAELAVDAARERET